MTADMREIKEPVYYAEGYDGDGEMAVVAVFSTKEKFEKWADLPENSEIGFVVVPFVIDVPEWGNRLKRKMS